MRLIILLLLSLAFSYCTKEAEQEPAKSNLPWKFAVVGDTHITVSSDTIKEMIPFFLEDSLDMVFICGDIAAGGLRTTASDLEEELRMFESIFSPLYEKGIEVYPMRGNHENDVVNNAEAWNTVFSGTHLLPQNGPAGEKNLSYSVTHYNTLFIILDNYEYIHRINQTWLDQQLSENTQPHIFVFGHESAFKVFHADCLDDYPAERNEFWRSLANNGVKSYFCGHDHFFDASKVSDADFDPDNDIYQLVVGGGGGWIMSRYQYNGNNYPYSPEGLFHRNSHGYALVKISGTTENDLDVAITWKERSAEQGEVKYVPTDCVIHYKAKGK